jgi:FlaA1/EpsC-like NDP-sugar epimerase
LIQFFNIHIPVRTFILGISEACLITLSFVAAAIVRLGTNDASLTLQYEQGFLKVLLLSSLFIVCIYYFDLYDSSVLSNRREVFARLVQALGAVSILLALVYYFYPPLELGRGIVLIGLPLVFIILSLWRELFFAFNRQLQFAERTMILGDEPAASGLLHELESRPELGFNVIGRILVAGGGSYELN